MKKTSTYARKRLGHEPWQRVRHTACHPVTEAVVVQRIQADIERLRTGAALHAYAGANAPALANLAGRLVYIVYHAAGLHGLGESPEARILAGTANALADLAERPDSIEQQRGAIVSGLAAIDRLMPQVATLSLAAGALELAALLEKAACRAGINATESIATSAFYISASGTFQG